MQYEKQSPGEMLASAPGDEVVVFDAGRDTHTARHLMRD
jgi:hypothetical protein